jgi:hypothetical protein
VGGRVIAQIALECRRDEGRGRIREVVSGSRREDLEELIVLAVEITAADVIPESVGNDLPERLGGS